MTLAYGNRVWETTNTTGTGNLLLNGARAGYQTFAQEIATQDFILYEIAVDGTPAWEVGYAQVIPGTPDQLVRYLVTQNSAGTQVPLSLPAGTHNVTSGIHKDVFYNIDTALQNLLVGGDYEYDATNGFTVAPGRLSIAGLTHDWATTLNGPGATGHTANTLHYVYLYNNTPGDLIPLIEVSTTAPVLSATYRYWAKSGDDSRRMIGFFRADATGAVHQFYGLRNGSLLSCFYDQNADTEVFDGQSTLAWSRVTNADQFLPVGTYEVTVSVSMSFLNQNNANKIGLHPVDLTSDPVSSGLYRQSFSANRDTDIIEDSNLVLTMVNKSPGLFTRNENGNGSTDYIINFDSARVNLVP